MKVNEISFLKGTLIFIKTCHEDSLLYEHVFVIRYLSYLDMRKVCSNLLDQICFNVLKKFFFSFILFILLFIAMSKLFDILSQLSIHLGLEIEN